ncbi:MAG TPA: cation diffusion facilitator family transporter [Chryseosolibacter sp.]|nr:cation diffusion facilitator family transporter [Chryseosolibacter sp.]
METALQNIRVQRWVLALSVTLLIGKLFAFYLTNSVAILTDALEGIVNVAAGIVGLYSLHVSAKPRDNDHPYGHGKIEFISAAAEGLMISIAGVLIIIEAVKHLIHPTELRQLDVGIVIVAVTAILNYIMGSVSVRTGKKNNSLALIASGKHLQSDTYSTVGLIVGLILILITKITWLDSAVAILFSSIILYTGFKIIRTSVAGIMDERDHVLLDQMIKVLDRHRRKNWIDLHNMRIIKYGSTLHIDCHVTVPWYLNVHEAHDEVEKVGEIVRTEFKHAIELFVHSDGCLPTSCPICIKDDCPVRHHAFEKRINWTVQNIEDDKKHQIST